MAALLATVVLLGLCYGASAQFGIMQEPSPGYFYFYASGQVVPSPAPPLTCQPCPALGARGLGLPTLTCASLCENRPSAQGTAHEEAHEA